MPSTEYPRTIVERDGDAPLRFNGKLVACVSSSPDTARSNYSGSTGRSATLSLYRTAAGKYICQREEHTQWQGERDRYQGAACTTIDEVREFFGFHWLAKQLYADAELDIAEIIE